MRVWVIAAVLLPILSVQAGKGIHLKAVDEDGQPLGDVTFTLSWYYGYGINPLRPKRGEGTFKGDDNGMAVVRNIRGQMIALRSAAKEGYVFERYLNDPGTNPYLDKNGTATETNPHVVILRKREERTSFLLDWGDLTRSSGGEASEGEAIPVSILADGMTDFYVEPTFDAASNLWTATFRSATGTCSLAVSTRRRYVAPEEGWSDRVTVPQAVYTNESFTLYVRAREPRLYAMIPQVIGIKRVRVMPYAPPEFRFSSSDLVLNPYGGRELERDARTNGFNSELRDEVLQALLKEHQYPPKPDIEARMANSEKRIELHREIINVRKEGTVLRKKIKEIEDQMSGKKSQKDIDLATEEYRKRLSDIGDVVQKCTREINRLEEEAHTLNLPEEGKRE